MIKRRAHMINCSRCETSTRAGREAASVLCGVCTQAGLAPPAADSRALANRLCRIAKGRARFETKRTIFERDPNHEGRVLMTSKLKGTRVSDSPTSPFMVRRLKRALRIEERDAKPKNREKQIVRKMEKLREQIFKLKKDSGGR